METMKLIEKGRTKDIDEFEYRRRGLKIGSKFYSVDSYSFDEKANLYTINFIGGSRFIVDKDIVHTWLKYLKL